VALGLEHGAFEGLDAAELAALAGALVYRPRNTGAGRPGMPTGPLEAAAAVVSGQWAGLSLLEQRHGLAPTPEPEPALARPLHAWARGATLQAVLADTAMAPGDFVHWAKRAIDLLDQLAAVAPMPPDFAGRCLEAAGLIRRSVVARAVLTD
jgi:ATP-dependent RNA helicase HelY